MGLLPLQNILFNLNQHFEAFSWSCHFVRIGTVVLLLHDCADPLLELSKLLKYARRQQMANIVFGCFFLVWTFTRLYKLVDKNFPTIFKASVIFIFTGDP